MISACTVEAHRCCCGASGCSFSHASLALALAVSGTSPSSSVVRRLLLFWACLRHGRLSVGRFWSHHRSSGIGPSAADKAWSPILTLSREVGRGRQRHGSPPSGPRRLLAVIARLAAFLGVALKTQTCNVPVEGSSAALLSFVDWAVDCRGGRPWSPTLNPGCLSVSPLCQKWLMHEQINEEINE